MATGNQEVVLHPLLERLLESGRCGETLVFFGRRAHAREQAFLFASKLLNTELELVEKARVPDVQLYQPAGKLALHTAEMMRDFGEEVCRRPYSKSAKVLIIQDADRMLAASSNALLKVLEEPPSTTWVILLSETPHLLPTLLSRSKRIFLQEPSQTEKTPPSWLFQWEELLNENPKQVWTHKAQIETLVKAIEAETKFEASEGLDASFSEKIKERLEKEQQAKATLTINESKQILFQTYLKHTLSNTKKLQQHSKLKRYQEHIDKANLMLERGMSLQLVLEGLLLNSL